MLLRSRRGFTLIELLVVIVIIAILAAIIFPVLTRAKSRASMATCSSNMKQWAFAMQSYCDQWDGRFPFAGAGDSWGRYHSRANKGYANCADALVPYLGKNKDVRWCPFAKARAKNKYKEAFESHGWSYWYFCSHGNDAVKAYPESVLCGYCVSDVSAPSKKPCISELMALHDPQEDGDGRYLYPQNLAYVDGHVATLMVNYRMRILTAYVGRNGVMPTKLKPPHGNE